MLSTLVLLSVALGADFKSAGKVSVSGVSEVPLYASVDPDDPHWYVEASVGEAPLLLRIATEEAGLGLTEGAAARAGLKVSGSGKARGAKVASMKIGEATFAATTASVATITTYGVDGFIGIAAFPDLAWAIDPAKGVVKIGPTGSGSVAASVGTGLPYTQAAARDQRVGKEKLALGAVPVTVEARVSGVAMPTSLATGRPTSRVAREVEGESWFSVKGHPIPAHPLPAFEGAWVGETEMEWREVAVGALSGWATVARQGRGLAAPFLPPASLGQEVLGRSSLGLDAGTKLVSFAAATGNAAVPYTERLGERLKKAAEAPAAEGQDADAAKAELVGKLTPWVKFLAGTGEAAAAVAPAKQMADARPELCTTWHAYGSAQLDSGDAAGAVVSLTKAGELYQAWAVRPLAERTKLAASEARRRKSPDFDGVFAQDHSCHTAWGELARAHIAAGTPAAVAELYPRYLDLDDALPLAAGTALLELGDKAGAESAFRQAVQLSYLASGEARGGMMLATRDRSAKLALAQVDAAPAGKRDELRFLHVEAEIQRANGGSAAVVAALKAYLAINPGSASAWLALAREEQQAGGTGAEALAKAESVLATRVQLTPWSGSVQALRAEHLRLAGKLAEAAAAAELATKLAPTGALGWYVRSLVAEAAGNADVAAEARKRAARVGPVDPLYASLARGS